eukprot:gene29437-5782_t
MKYHHCILSYIPDKLLAHVAIPRHPPPPLPLGAVASIVSSSPESPHRIVIVPSGGAVHILDDVNVSKILGVMPYFDIFLNSDTATEEEVTIPVPCSIESFVGIYDALKHSEFTVFPTPGASTPGALRFMINRVVVDADILGLRIDYLTKLRQMVLESLDIFARCPEMWHATNRERLWRLMESFGRESSGGVLQDLHDSMRVSYIPLDMDGEWLFGGLKPVDHILSKYAGKLVLAGGAVLGLVGNSSLVKPGSDYDLFFVGVTEDEATDILDEVGSSFTEAGCTVLCTKHAMTIVTNPPDTELSHKKVIQLILRLHSTCAHVIMGFDIAPSKILAYYESSQDEDEPHVMRVKFATTWLPAMRHAFFTVDLFCWGRGSIARIFKYMYKGFNCFIPAGKRHLMALNSSQCITNGRLSGLFAAERMIETNRIRNTPPPPTLISYIRNLLLCNWSASARSNPIPSASSLLRVPLTSSELILVLRRACSRSDYDIRAKFTNRLKYIVRSIWKILSNGRTGTFLLFHTRSYYDTTLIYNQSSGANDEDQKKYRFQPIRRMGMFYPMDAVFEEVYPDMLRSPELFLD